MGVLGEVKHFFQRELIRMRRHHREKKRIRKRRVLTKEK